jgi:hypothetical protein
MKGVRKRKTESREVFTEVAGERAAARFSIGELAERAHVNRETVRYYERRRLLPQPTRSVSGIAYSPTMPSSVSRSFDTLSSWDFRSTRSASCSYCG